MVEEKQTKENKMEEGKEEVKVEDTKKESKVKENKMEEGKEIKEEVKKEDKAEKKEEKKESKTKENKTAIINGISVPISTKHSMAICNFIRGKEIDKALVLLEQASLKKIPIPMRGEIPHRKGIMSGRYPINAIGHFIKLLKGLKANAIVKDIEFEKYRIACKANLASRPYRRFGKGKFKRTHVTLKLVGLNQPLSV
jgi:ribosomal protein L22